MTQWAGRRRVRELCSGVLLNPALLAKAKPEDNITVVLPAVGVQITDKDNLVDEIDDISDKVDYYDEVVDNLTLGQILLNPRGVLNQFQGAARGWPMSWNISTETARANAGAGLAVSIRGKRFPWRLSPRLCAWAREFVH